MKIAIYQIINEKGLDEHEPRYIIWDLDERKRLSVATDFKKAVEIAKDIERVQ